MFGIKPQSSVLVLTFVIFFRMVMGLTEGLLHDLDVSGAKVTTRFVK